MAQSDLVKVAIGVAVGALVATVAALVLTGRIGGGDKETKVTLLQMPDGRCSTDKVTHVKVKQEKHLTWKIENRCTTEQIVAVGNFRKDFAGGGSNCSAAGSASPFPGQQPASVPVPPGEKRQIKLTAKKLEKPDAPEAYYFDFCLNSVSADPTLMIER